MPAFSDHLGPNESLHRGQYLSALDGRFGLLLQANGNLVLFKNYRYLGRPGVALWASNTAGKGARTCVMQADGNLVLYDAYNRAVWSSDTWQFPGSGLLLQPNGNAVIFSPDNESRWATNTVSAIPPSGPPALGSAMLPGQTLPPREGLSSPNGKYTLTFQRNGNLVLFRNHSDGAQTYLWSTQTANRPAEVCILQPDGNIALFDGDGNRHWISNAGYHPGSRLSVENDGKLLLRTPGGQTVWYTYTGENEGIRFNELYFVLHHNTYDHGGVVASLNQGLRAVELDVVDSGDWQSDPDGPFVAHETGWDTPPPRLGEHLRQITGWMDQNPDRGPILVFVDLKTTWTTYVEDWLPSKVDRLDSRINEILGARQFTAANLFQHATGAEFVCEGRSLRHAVVTGGWPLANSLRDRVLVFFTGGRWQLANQTQSAGICHILSSRGLPFGFFCPDIESDPDELKWDKCVDGMALESSQCCVAGNLKACDHYQITANLADRLHQVIHLWNNHVLENHEYAYNHVAVAHGIGVIGRDDDARPGSVIDTYNGSIPLVGRRRSLPGYFELRPYHAFNKCLDVTGARRDNGAPLQLWDVRGGDNQRFVYTAEGQLRPKHVNTHGVDIDGGRALDGKWVHLWRCDGGNSEKWVLEPSGVFRSFDKRDFVLDVHDAGTDNGRHIITYRLHGGPNQRFVLVPVPEWEQSDF